MDTEEAINRLEVLKSIIEWEYSIDFQIALDIAIDSLKEESARTELSKNGRPSSEDGLKRISDRKGEVLS